MSTHKKKKSNNAYGLGNGFAKALKEGVNRSIKAHHLEGSWRTHKLLSPRPA